MLPTGIAIQDKNVFRLANNRVCTLTLNDFTSKTPIYIFNICNTNGKPLYSYSNDYSKIYYFKIWSNNELVRDYIPAMRTSDRKVGFYDLAKNKFYINPGNTNFTQGPVSSKSVGELMDNSKYSIPIKVQTKKGDVELNIVLDEPLRKQEDIVDYIDLANKKVVRKLQVTELNEVIPLENPIEETLDINVSNIDFSSVYSVIVDSEVLPYDIRY